MGYIECAKCGRKIPEDSDFCQYCGESPVHEQPGEEPLILPTEEKKRNTIPIIVLTVATIALAGLNVFQLFHNKTNPATAQSASISDEGSTAGLGNNLETEIAKLKEELSLKEETISQMKKDSEEYEKKALLYNEACFALGLNTLGFASEEFYASDSVVVMSKDGGGRQIGLMANWDAGGEVSIYEPADSAARASIDDDSWNESTTVTIKPIHEGVATLKFSNDDNGEFFHVVVIVTA